MYAVGANPRWRRPTTRTELSPRQITETRATQRSCRGSLSWAVRSLIHRGRPDRIRGQDLGPEGEVVAHDPHDFVVVEVGRPDFLRGVVLLLLFFVVDFFLD